jgi:hypothetical protein
MKRHRTAERSGFISIVKSKSFEKASKELEKEPELASIDPRLKKLAAALSAGGNITHRHSNKGTPKDPPGIPPMPSNWRIGAPKVPMPPKLDPSWSPEETFRFIALCWMNTIRAYYGVKVDNFELQDAFPRRVKRGKRFVVLPPRPQRSKHWKRVMALAEELRERQIPPAAWFAFRFDVWKYQCEDRLDFTKAGRVPPVAWVITPSSVAKHHRWYTSCETTYVSGATVVCPKHKQLLLDWERMYRVARHCRELHEVKDVIARFFPGDSYKRRVQEAREEAKAMQRRFNERVRRGYHLWAL